MNQQPDKLFREKLEGLHQTVPSAAWSKIEAGLQKKNNKAIWFRVAAAVLLVAVAAFLIWTSQPSTRLQVVAETNIKKETPSQNQKTEQVKAPEANLDRPEQAQTPIVKADRRKKIQPSISQPVEEVNALVEERSSIEEITFAQEQINLNDSSSIATIMNITEETTIAKTSIEEENTSEESRVLVLSVEEVDAKYLDKEALAKATSAQKKSSTFRKLLNKAYDLKYNQDPFGDLRQKKNEILALNFKSEKRSQNK